MAKYGKNAQELAKESMKEIQKGELKSGKSEIKVTDPKQAIAIGLSKARQVRDQVVLVHAFTKKTQQLKEKDIELAERRMEEWMRRHLSGGRV